MAKGGRGRGRHGGGQQRGGGTATAVRGAGPGTRAPANMADAARHGGAEVQPWGLADAMNAIAARAGLSNPMPRSALDQVPFGPNWALPPQPLDPARPDTGRPEPRVFEYPVAFNIPGNGNRPIPWNTLYAASTNVDIVRRCIEIRKRHLRGMEWGFSVTEEAIAEALLGDPASGRMDVETKLREQYLPEIRRATEFWRKPWKANGLSFGQWLNGWMDQHLVLDGVAVYPRTTYGGDVTDLEIIDASTIKLLLDNRGARPEHPFPAFQQELYGFPRGEFTVSVGEDGMMHGGYAADQLYYHRENFRPQTPYGFSAVEQCLISARLYLKRQGWMLAEYDDGSTPLMWLVPAPTAEMWSQMDANQRRRWEQSLNDEMAGNQGGRHRVKVTPPGFNPIAMPSVDERYKPEYDMFLIKMAAGFFNVTVAELGLTEPKGLGSSGYHEGQEAVEGRVGQRPDTVMVAESINDLSYDFLRIPREIEFKFIDPQADDEKTKAEVAGMRRARATITLNDERREIGMAPLPFKEADMPMLIMGDKATPLEGLAKVLELAQQAQQASLEASNAQMEADGETADLEAEELEGASAEKALEMASYRRWARKRGGRAGRMFICKALDPADWPGSAVPADVDFEHWEWVPDDAEIVKAFGGNDNWRTLARDHRGRWMPRGRMRVDPLGPATPGKEVLSGLQRDAERRRSAAQADAAEASQRAAQASRNRADAAVARMLREAEAKFGEDRANWPDGRLGMAAREGDERAQAVLDARRNPNALAERIRAEQLGETAEEQRAAELRNEARRAEEAAAAARERAEIEAEEARMAAAAETSTESQLSSVDTPTTIDPVTTTKPTKRSYTVTLPDGSTQTRRTERNYTHAVILTKDNHALAALFEERAATAASRGRQNDADRAAAAAAEYRSLPRYEYSLVSMSASAAGAAKRAAELEKRGPWFRAEVREATADAPAQSPAAVTPEAGNVAAREFPASVDAAPSADGVRAAAASAVIDSVPGLREGVARQQPQAFPRSPRNAKPKTEHRVTLPDGTVATRSSQHDYTHAVVTTRDNRAYARHLEAEAQRDVERGFVERAGWREQVAQLNAGPAVTYGAPAFSASLADARTAARKHATPYQTTRVVSVDTPDGPVTVREEGRQNNPGFALPTTPPAATRDSRIAAALAEIPEVRQTTRGRGKQAREAFSAAGFLHDTREAAEAARRAEAERLVDREDRAAELDRAAIEAEARNDAEGAALARADRAQMRYEDAQARTDHLGDLAESLDTDEARARHGAAVAESDRLRAEADAAERAYNAAQRPRLRAEQDAADQRARENLAQLNAERAERERKAAEDAAAEIERKAREREENARRVAEIQAETRAELARRTPEAFALMLDGGDKATTHAPSRKILAEMREQGWVMTHMNGSMMRFEAPDGRGIRMTYGRDRVKWERGDYKGNQTMGESISLTAAAALVGVNRPPARKAEAVAASTPDAPEAPEAPAAKLSRKQREMAERFDQLAGEHATDPDVAMWRGRAIDLVGQMEQVGGGVLAQREAGSIRDQMGSVQLGFTHAMAGAQAAAEVRAAGGDERAQRIARSKATLDSRARKVQKDLEHVERQIRDYTGETRKMLRKRINDLKAERQRYLDRIERVERDVDTKLVYDESGRLIDVRYEPPR